MIAALVGRTRWLIDGRSSTAAVIQTTILQIVTLGANLATGVLTARLLAPAGRGELAAINLIPALTGSLLTLGVPAALLYYLKRKPEDSARLIGSSLIVTTVLGVVGMIAGYAIMPYALHQYPAHVVLLARIFMVTAPMALFTYLTSSVFDAAGNFWYGNASRFLAPLITLASLCVFWATGHLDVLTAATSYALPALPIAVKMLVDVAREYHPSFSFTDREPYADLFRYGLKSFGVDIINRISQQIDQVLVIAFLSPAAMGLYAVALAISRILQLFQSSIVRVLLPRIAARPIDEVVDAVGRATRVTAILTIPFCLTVIALAPFLLRLAYGGKFSSASGVLRILCVEALFAGLTWILAQAFLGLGRPGIVTTFQGFGLALTFPLMLFLIPRYGLAGAGGSLLISTLVRFVLVIASYPWLLKTSPPQLLVTRDDFMSILARLRVKRGQAPPQEAA